MISLTDRQTAAVTLGLLALLPLAWIGAGSHQRRLFVLFLVFAILAMALNIVFAHTDQLYLFLGALTGIGTYTTALVADALGVTAWIVLPVGALAAGAVGLTVSYVAARRGMTLIVLAILTLSLQLGVMEFFVGAREITGGTTGFRFRGLDLSAVTEPLGVDSLVGLYYVLLVVLAAVFALYLWLRNSRYGLAFTAIRQDEVAAESVGIDVVRYRTIAGFLAAFIVGFVGPLYAQSEGFVFPSMFAFQQIDILVLIVLVIGGMRTLLGPVVGAATMVIVVDEVLQDVGQWRTAILGALLIVLFLYFREGIVPKAREVIRSRT